MYENNPVPARIHPEFPLNPEESEFRRAYQGAFWGVVEYTTDPFLLGRVRVRVPDVYGDENQTPTDLIPWALPCFPGFMFSPPQVGDGVWVIFQQGDSQYPVYMGWCPATPTTVQFRQRHPKKIKLQYRSPCDHIDENNDPRMPLSEDTLTAGEEPEGANIETYSTPAGIPETPPECRKSRTWDPNIRQVMKSWRGHTIQYDDNPECEHLKIIDRFGQQMTFECAVKWTPNLNNASPRGDSITNMVVRGIGEADRLVKDGRTQLPIVKAYQRPGENEKCRITITDALSQYMEFWAERDRARIRIQGSRRKDDDRTPNHWIQISSKIDPPDEHIELASREGHSIRIDETKNWIRIKHKAPHTQEFNPNNIILALENTHKRLVWLENLMMKYNSHQHTGCGGPALSGPPTVPLTDGDGTTITLAG